jgi:hypothetical protein|tara:strand:+ start:43 stop:747 length:705 start_codon:yes stop_codon:yes gene_type:complete
MRNDLSKKNNYREKVMLYFVDGKPTKPYREIAKLAGCSLGMVSYYKDTKKAIMNINKNSGRDKWHQVWAFCFRKRGKKAEPKPETFTTLLRKKGRSFLYGCKKYTNGDTYMNNKSKLKHKGIGVKVCLNKVWPGIRVDEKESKQALHPHTKQPDYYDDGKPIMSPYVRSAITGKIINAKSNYTEVDHIDGDRSNNHPDNFSFVERYANSLKGELSYKELYNKICEVKNFLGKYV